MIRFGFGYDIHRFAPKRKLILGGVHIPSKLGLLGHSDADVLLHAICDALLGAAALGDIGQHFPDSAPQFKGISSLKFLTTTRELLDAAGYRLLNIDSTLVLQAPKIAPHILAMRQKIAKALKVGVDQVSVKATTNEGLGALGAGEGCAAYAVASIELATARGV
ncbi:MAG: 2-C-methyl-D-erythritol 2,4-cyclodiphosphate synthase [Acidobacteriales bacterium]|nr:2-C-methyl-D-erythritol 2,4-cyclodiphosphate synthase [Terriglobales bacterium]MCI0624374.1 2-C-methyl-D-erythritol 2,4-cyclodiphosphate synthase [Acidobacteriota bacterium]MCI0723449.1 2-C-methyl-D-erythritol 2,4-cyclodiphosphate synthase [Acidobacteriota bacterium]